MAIGSFEQALRVEKALVRGSSQIPYASRYLAFIALIWLGSFVLQIASLSCLSTSLTSQLGLRSNLEAARQTNAIESEEACALVTTTWSSK